MLLLYDESSDDEDYGTIAIMIQTIMITTVTEGVPPYPRQPTRARPTVPSPGLQLQNFANMGIPRTAQPGLPPKGKHPRPAPLGQVLFPDPTSFENSSPSPTLTMNAQTAPKPLKLQSSAVG